MCELKSRIDVEGFSRMEIVGLYNSMMNIILYQPLAAHRYGIYFELILRKACHINSYNYWDSDGALCGNLKLGANRWTNIVIPSFQIKDLICWGLAWKFILQFPEGVWVYICFVNPKARVIWEYACIFSIHVYELQSSSFQVDDLANFFSAHICSVVLSLLFSWLEKWQNIRMSCKCHTCM